MCFYWVMSNVQMIMLPSGCGSIALVMNGTSRRPPRRTSHSQAKAGQKQHKKHARLRSAYIFQIFDARALPTAVPVRAEDMRKRTVCLLVARSRVG